MKVIRCYVKNFGCYSDLAFDFSGGLNSFFLKNGEGKTTLAFFLKAMFYSLEKSSKSSYERKHYKPYSGGEYGGSLTFEIGGAEYRVERTFGDSPSKDSLTIYDEKGVQQGTFLSKPVSCFQGEDSSKFGELVFGIDAASFSRCNFVVSSDLDFAASESVKMKIGNVVIDSERENSFEDTLNAIEAGDLREKAPTRKNENAYPFRVKELERENKGKRDEIRELDQLERGLPALYAQRQAAKEELDRIDGQLKDLSAQHVMRGKMAVIEGYDSEIEEKSKTIEAIRERFNGRLPSEEEAGSLSSKIKEWERLSTIGETLSLQPSEKERLERLEGKVVSESDYALLLEAKSKMEAADRIPEAVAALDENRYSELKARFEGKALQDDAVLDENFIAYRTLLGEARSAGGDFFDASADYPSENVLHHIDEQIKKHEELAQEAADCERSFQEPPILLVILLAVLTLGIYLVVLRKKKKDHRLALEGKRQSLRRVSEELDSFFAKYGKSSGSYEFRLAELRDDIAKRASAERDDSRNRKRNELMRRLEERRSRLLAYFSLFGYSSPDVDQSYGAYRKDIEDYRALKRERSRDDSILRSAEDDAKKQRDLADTILSKYGLVRKEGFAEQLNELREDLNFYRRCHPRYANFIANEEERAKTEAGIFDLLRSLQLNPPAHPVPFAKGILGDLGDCAKAEAEKAELLHKREAFIEENGLGGFVPENIEEHEEQLRKVRETRVADLQGIESQIGDVEARLAERDALDEAIARNRDAMEEYQARIDIARHAASAFREAYSEMVEKYIDPVKEAFLGYAKKIHEKIGTDVAMSFDYEVKYAIKGQLRDAKDLSDGERAIMMLALRFAILDSLYKDRDSIIVLDDPFENLDSEKIAKAMEVISELSSSWQIFYFTCHESRSFR